MRLVLLLCRLLVGAAFIAYGLVKILGGQFYHGDFVIDSLPGHPHVVIASPCSGHGFKFAPVIGEIVADLVTKSAQRHEIGRFSLKRFA